MGAYISRQINAKLIFFSVLGYIYQAAFVTFKTSYKKSNGLVKYWHHKLSDRKKEMLINIGYVKYVNKIGTLHHNTSDMSTSLLTVFFCKIISTGHEITHL